jgi:hypothetical protein
MEVSGLYKIIAKVLANRLQYVLEQIISRTQNDFIKGCQILDFFSFANEGIDGHLKLNETGVLCKLDLEEAYEHVSWDSLLCMLRRCGYGEKWQSWIEHCISTVWFSILINGTPSGVFFSVYLMS